ncbi:MAG TPA: DNA gyrase subunit A [Desulfotomaculum sp.]|nr:DNA gyrase subunit A [Desulfotomaculum sp.]HBY04481.1 DNA gyrase subunit A [Desulfotomaculum sp.]
MKHSYLDYAMSVIIGRALPDVRDGLKPVHRKIIYGMYKLGMTSEKPHRKSANVVGFVLQKFHPHGDVSVYDAMVRLAQNFACRYPLIDGHGNFGSLDGDAPAAMRYTEARLAKIAGAMLTDIDKETVDFIPNYDETDEEPVILPSRIPNLLINGSSGIAVGMATNIPPHNLGEVIDGIIMLIDDPQTTVEQIMDKVQGPDFPTGGFIMGHRGIREAYSSGRGSIKMRAKTEIEKIGSGKEAIIVNEIPYMVNKARLVEKIAELVKEKKIDGITDLRDESDRKGLRVVIELRRGVDPQVILNYLYKHTQLQESFGVIMLVLVEGKPQVLNLREILYHYLKHQKEVVTRRTKFELNKAEERIHIVEGLIIALDHIDQVIETIRSSRTVEIARKALCERFDLTQKQADAILDMRLQRLTGLEREKLDREYEELREKISTLRGILADEAKVYQIIKEELKDIKEKFSDQRRTQILTEEVNLNDEDLIAEEEVVITVSNQGYIKRIPLDTYRRQRRGGRGVLGMGTKEEDFVQHLFISNTHHYLMFFTSKGKAYRLKVYEIPEAVRQAKGLPLVNLLSLEAGEKITAIIPVKKIDPDSYLFMATSKGVVKKTRLDAFDSNRKGGVIAVTLDEDDDLVDVMLTDGNSEVIIGTRNGLAIKFNEEQVSSHGRTSRGVRGILLEKDDVVVGLGVITPRDHVLVVTANGHGKRTPVKNYRLQNRGGHGVINIKTSPKTGPVVALKVVKEDEELLLISKEGIIIRMKTSEISVMGRSTRGVLIMRLDKDDLVVGVARISSEEEE